MYTRFTGIWARILPFVILGCGVVLFIFAFVILSYVVLIGSIIGLIFFAIAYLKRKFFGSGQAPTMRHKQRGHQSRQSNKFQGKTYDHDSFK
jgi:uncharacterized RDD family membrane protein YckC